MRLGIALDYRLRGTSGVFERAWARARTNTAFPHILCLSALFLVSAWLMRRFLFTSALPSGTDMLDVFTRARENAHWDQLVSPWSPSILGLPRQATLDNLLGLFTMVTGGPVWTVKLLMFVSLFGAGAFTYLLIWRWYRSPFAAGVAGLLYMVSQSSLGRIASGWLHYELLITFTPLLIYFWVECVDRFSMRRAIAFTLLVNGLIFVRQDMVLWVLPYLLVYVPIRLGFDAGKLAIRNVIATLRIFLPATLALSFYLILPLLGGIRAPWLSTNRIFAAVQFNLIDRSLDAYQSLLGLGRDLGYLPFIGQEWWKFHPYMPQSLYYATASVIVVLAYVAIWRHRDRRTIYLLACAVLATFLAKGIRGPLGSPYLWGVDNLPVFGNLRGPNRWLIVQTLVYASLAGLTLDWTAHSLKRVSSPLKRLPRAPLYAGVTALTVAMLLPVAPTLLSGFATWRPEPGQVALMQTVQRDRARFAVASVPYNQFMRFFVQGNHRGYEHDLGVDSPLFTGHPALSNGSWDRTTPDFVAFTSSLLTAHNPAFAELLGAIGIKYLLNFNYPVTAPDLVAEARGDPFYQQRSVHSMNGLQPVQQNGSGTLYKLDSRAPFMSFRSNVALILGGRSGLASLANLPGIRLQDWAAFTADDVLSYGGRTAFTNLINLIRGADLLLVSNETLQDVAVLASPPVARVPGITSDTGLDRRTALLLTDESLRRGSLADQKFPPPALISSATSSFRLAQPRRLELWTRILTGSSAGVVRFAIDGQKVLGMIPIAPGRGGFRWYRVGTRVFAPGTHEIEVSGRPSKFGASFEVDETRLIDPLTRQSASAQLTAALRGSRGKIAYSLDVDGARYRNVHFIHGTYENAGHAVGKGRFWGIREPARTSIALTQGPEVFSRRVILKKPRRFYTFVQHVFRAPQDWDRRSYVLLPFRGTGDGRQYDFIADFNYRHTSFASFKLIDSRKGWQMAAFRMRAKRGDWSHVVSVRLATRLKASTGVLDLAPLRLFFPNHLALTYPLIGDAARRSAFLSKPTMERLGHAKFPIPRRRNNLRASIPLRLLGRDLRFTVPASQTLKPRPAIRVASAKSGVAKYNFTFDAPRWGVLVFNQRYDQKWRARSDGLDYPSLVPASSLVNGFFFGPGHHSGSVEFKGRKLAVTGIMLSGVALFALLCLAFAPYAWKKRPMKAERYRGPEAVAPPSPRATVRWRHDEFWDRNERLVWISTAVVASALIAGAFSFAMAAAIVIAAAIRLRAKWWLPWSWALAFVLLMPIYIAIGENGLADNMAIVVTLCMLLALALLVLEERRRETRR
jgi:hypothetical protein